MRAPNARNGSYNSPAGIKENNHIVRVNLVQDRARPFVEHVEIEAFRLQKIDPSFDRRSVMAQRDVYLAGQLGLQLQCKIGAQATVSLHRVKGEVTDDGHPHDRGDNLSALPAKFVEYEHGDIESLPESRVNLKRVFDSNMIL